MPSALIFFKQETPYSCVAACLKTALAYFGVEASEDELRLRSYTTHLGTSACDAVACVRSYGLYAAEVRNGSLGLLQKWLKQPLLPILFIDLQPIHGEFGRHAIVAEGISETQLTYLDPLKGRRTSELGLVEQAWRLAIYRAILISNQPLAGEDARSGDDNV
ncbi:MAG TPA: cysteine peptidase family C39 domain-containing protein [Anaerolineales bacterium]|nr:cysteine peptidase family C39 domain-containing protein [Anaerolineales bacterium]